MGRFLERVSRAVIGWFTAPAIDIEGSCAHCPYRNALPPDPGGKGPCDFVPPASGSEGVVMLSDEVMPIAVDDNLLRKFEVWSSAPLVLAPRRPWYTRIWRLPRAWVPGTLEWRFRRWASGRATVVSE